MSQAFVYLDGKYVPDSEARIPLLTHALHYGTGIFEGIRAYHDPAPNGMILFRARDHFERMAHNVKLLKMELPLPADCLVEVAAELIRLNCFTTDVYVRPLAYKSGARIGVSLPAETSFAMIAVPMGAYLDASHGVHCGVSSWRRLQDNSIPCRAKICGAYVNSALAAQEARDRGFDEAIVLNESGHVAEGSAMNLFLVREGRLITPDVSQGILEGITRDTVKTFAHERGWSVEERAVDRTELYIADEVFLCGTAAEIAPVIRVDGRDVGSGRIGPITRELREMYDRAVHGHSIAHRAWLKTVSEPVFAQAG